MNTLRVKRLQPRLLFKYNATRKYTGPLVKRTND